MPSLEERLQVLFHAPSEEAAMRHAERQLRRVLRKGANLRDLLPVDADDPLEGPLRVLAVLHHDPEALLPKYPRIKLMYEVFSMLLLQHDDGSFPSAEDVDHDVEPFNGCYEPFEYLGDLQEYNRLPAGKLEQVLRKDTQDQRSPIFALAQVLLLRGDFDGSEEHCKIVSRLLKRAPVLDILFGRRVKGAG